MNNWVGPVYARLQRRFVRFLSSNVEEKEDEIYLQAFDKLLEKIDYEVHPKYTLSLSETDAQDKDSKLSSAGSGSGTVVFRFLILLLMSTVLLHYVFFILGISGYLK